MLKYAYKIPSGPPYSSSGDIDNNKIYRFLPLFHTATSVTWASRCLWSGTRVAARGGGGAVPRRSVFTVPTPHWLPRSALARGRRGRLPSLLSDVLQSRSWERAEVTERASASLVTASQQPVRKLQWQTGTEPTESQLGDGRCDRARLSIARDCDSGASTATGRQGD
eukprot:g21439.t1